MPKMGDATDQIWTIPEVPSHGLKDTQVTKQCAFNLAKQHNAKSSGYKIVPSRNAYSFYYKDHCSPHGIKSSDGIFSSQSISCKDVMQREQLPNIHNSYGNMQNSLEATTQVTDTGQKQALSHLQQVDCSSNNKSKEDEGVDDEHVLCRSFKSVEVIVHDTSIFSKDYDNLLESHSPVRIRQQMPRDAQGTRCNWIVKEQRLWLYQCPYRYRQVKKSKRVSIPCGVPLPHDSPPEYILTECIKPPVNGSNDGLSNIPKITEPVWDSEKNKNVVRPNCKHCCVGAKKDKRLTFSLPAIIRRSFRISCLQVGILI